MYRQTFFRLLIVVCLISIMVVGHAHAAGFSDTRGHWAEKEINKWAQDGLAGGYADGTFKPDGKVTRAEFVALVNRAFKIEKQSAAGVFSDVNSGAWYYDDVCTAKAAGYTGGYEDGTFRPDKTITRQEVAAVLARLLDLEASEKGIPGFGDAHQIPRWSRAAIGAVVGNKLMGGFPDNTFKPLRSITRAEAVVSLDRAMQFNPGNVPAKPAPGEETAVQGTVSVDGNPVKAAVVRIFAAGSYDVLAQTLTNSNGIYHVKLEPGDYDITVSTSTAVSYASDVTVKENNIREVNLSLQPAAVLAGKIEDENGKGVEDAAVLYTTNPTFVAYTGENGAYEIPVLPGRSYDVRVRKSGDDEDQITLVAENVEVTAAGKKSVDTFEVPSSETSSPGGGGGPGGGGSSVADNTPPKFTYASITVDSDTIEADLSSDGLRGTIDLRNQDEDSKIVKGTLTASEDATLKMELTSVPEEYRDIISRLMSTTQKLKGNEPATMEAFKILDSGLPLSLLKIALSDTFTLEGTLEDASGNVSHVSLTIFLP